MATWPSKMAFYNSTLMMDHGHKVGQMKIARSYHGASVVNVYDISDYCQAPGPIL